MKGQFRRNPRHGQGPTKEKSERVPVHQNDSQVLFDKQRRRERTLAAPDKNDQELGKERKTMLQAFIATNCYTKYHQTATWNASMVGTFGSPPSAETTSNASTCHQETHQIPTTIKHRTHPLVNCWH